MYEQNLNVRILLSGYLILSIEKLAKQVAYNRNIFRISKTRRWRVGRDRAGDDLYRIPIMDRFCKLPHFRRGLIMQIKLDGRHRDRERARSRIGNGIERNSGIPYRAAHDFEYISPAPMLRLEGRYPYRLTPKVSKTLRRFPSVLLSPTRGRTRISIPAEDKERTTSFLEPF